MARGETQPLAAAIRTSRTPPPLPGPQVAAQRPVTITPNVISRSLNLSQHMTGRWEESRQRWRVTTSSGFVPASQPGQHIPAGLPDPAPVFLIVRALQPPQEIWNTQWRPALARVAAVVSLCFPPALGTCPRPWPQRAVQHRRRSPPSCAVNQVSGGIRMHIRPGSGGNTRCRLQSSSRHPHVPLIREPNPSRLAGR